MVRFVLSLIERNPSRDRHSVRQHVRFRFRSFYWPGSDFVVAKNIINIVVATISDVVGDIARLEIAAVSVTVIIQSLVVSIDNPEIKTTVRNR